MYTPRTLTIVYGKKRRNIREKKGNGIQSILCYYF